MGKKNVNRPTMLVAMKDNKRTWGWMQCVCVCLCRRIQRRNMIVWMSKVESWKRSIKRSIVRCNKLLEKRYTIIEERRIVSGYISLCIYTHIYKLTYVCIYTRLEERENRRNYRYCLAWRLIRNRAKMWMVGGVIANHNDHNEHDTS